MLLLEGFSVATFWLLPHGWLEEFARRNAFMIAGALTRWRISRGAYLLLMPQIHQHGSLTAYILVHVEISCCTRATSQVGPTGKWEEALLL